MVAGHLQEKNGYFYAVLSYKDSSNKRKTKWIPTGYPVKGNKKKAEAFLTEQRKAFEIPEEDMTSAAPDDLFRTIWSGGFKSRSAPSPSRRTAPMRGCCDIRFSRGSGRRA